MVGKILHQLEFFEVSFSQIGWMPGLEFGR
jgi:hypothetical protein